LKIVKKNIFKCFHDKKSLILEEECSHL